jgi:hypothetical protein
MTTVIAPVRTPEEERRRRRAAWPIRQFRLGEEPGDDLAATTTAEERLAMMWPLAVDAFCVGGLPNVASPRAHWPVKVRRLGDPEAD